MSAQIKALTKAVAKLTANKGNKNVNPNTNNGNKGNSKRHHPQGQPQPQQLMKLRNMGATAIHMVFIRSVLTMTAKPAIGRLAKQH
jgi:hypothetical protein